MGEPFSMLRRRWRRRTLSWRAASHRAHHARMALHAAQVTSAAPAQSGVAQPAAIVPRAARTSATSAGMPASAAPTKPSRLLSRGPPSPAPRSGPQLRRLSEPGAPPEPPGPPCRLRLNRASSGSASFLRPALAPPPTAAASSAATLSLGACVRGGFLGTIRIVFPSSSHSQACERPLAGGGSLASTTSSLPQNSVGTADSDLDLARRFRAPADSAAPSAMAPALQGAPFK